MWQRRLGGAVVAVLAIVGAACASGDAASERPSATTATGADSTATSEAPTSSTDAAPPVPATRFDADRWYEPGEIGLPSDYASDLGDDLYERQRTQRIRGDLADFAHAVRAFDAERSDELAWRLQAYPFAVCALEERLIGGFDGYVGRVDGRLTAAADTAAALSVAAPVVATPSRDPTLAFAVAEARRRFCPEEGRAVGDPTGVLPGWADDENGRVDIGKTAVPQWAFPDPRFDTELRRFSVAAAYIAVASAPDLAGNVMAEVMLFPTMCSARADYEKLAQPPSPDNYAADPPVEAEDVLVSLIVSLTGLATIELGCPPDWMEL